MSFKIFSEIDLSPKGKIASEYPCWYFTPMIESLKEDILRDEINIDRGRVPKESEPEYRETLAQKKLKLQKIEEAFPQLNDMDRGRVGKMYEDLGKKISTLVPSRSEEQFGTADAHKMVEKMTRPCVKLESLDAIKFAKACNVKVTEDGMVTLNGAEKTWKLAGRLLDADSDTAVLRRA